MLRHLFPAFEFVDRSLEHIDPFLHSLDGMPAWNVIVVGHPGMAPPKGFRADKDGGKGQ